MYFHLFTFRGLTLDPFQRIKCLHHACILLQLLSAVVSTMTFKHLLLPKLARTALHRLLQERPLPRFPILSRCHRPIAAFLLHQPRQCRKF